MRAKLTNNQGIRAGVVFLNMLGIDVLDDAEENKNTYSLFYNDILAGMVKIDKSTVTINAQTQDFKLSASYEIPYASGMEDEESGFDGLVYADWSSNINFKLITNENMAVSGNILINSSADKEFGLRCRTHSKFSVENSKLGNFDIKLNYDGYNFYYLNEREDKIETIEIQLIQDRICHKTESDFVDGEWQTRLSNGIIKMGHDKLNCYRRVQKRDENKGYIYDAEYNAEEKDIQKGDIEHLVQLGNEAQISAPEMYEKIREIRKALKIGNLSILDSVILVGNDNDEIVKALFGYLPKNIAWQNGANNLIEAYFGIGENFKLLK